jgi:hypothetical protein
MSAEIDRPHDPLQEALEAVVDVLVHSNIAYCLIGGLATGFRARPRYTKDIDLMLDIPQIALPHVLDSLHDRGFEFDTHAVIDDFTRHHLAVLWRKGVRLDWLKPVLPAYRHVLERAAEEQSLSCPIRVATAEGLVLLKLLAFRLQDQTDVEALVAANRETLDVAWIAAEWEAIFPREDPRMQWFMSLVNDSRSPQ